MHLRPWISCSHEILEPAAGLEPATYSLQNCCSTGWAKPASWVRHPRNGSEFHSLNDYSLLVGRRGFEPLKANAGWFTVTCVWPLRYLPQQLFGVPKLLANLYVSMEKIEVIWGWDEIDGAEQVYILWIKNCAAQSISSGAVDRNWTGDLLLTMELLYQLSYNGV